MQDNTFTDATFLTEDAVAIKENKTVYLNPQSGDDNNDGLGESTAVKTIAGAMAVAGAGDTILICGPITTRNFFSGIDKPVTLQGAGDTPLSYSSTFTVPANVNGLVKLVNFSFDASYSIMLYGISSDYVGLDLALDNCRFTKAGGNCVFITPQIHSLTVTNCTFTAPSDATNYQKQYLIWPAAAKTITITDNSFDGRELTRSAIHLGDGHPEGTTAVIENNDFTGFERGVQLAFINDAANDVTISNNQFYAIEHSVAPEAKPGEAAEPYEVGTVFFHASLKPGTTVTYMGNELADGSQRIFYTENGTLSAEDLITSFTGNTIDGNDAGTLEENWYDAFVAQIGTVQFQSLSDALTAAGNMTEDVVITLLADIDLSDDFTSSSSLSYDLSTSALKSLTIQGAS